MGSKTQPPEGYGTAAELARLVGVNGPRISCLQQQGLFDSAKMVTIDGRTFYNLKLACEIFSQKVDQSQNRSGNRRKLVCAVEDDQSIPVSLFASDEEFVKKSVNMNFSEARALKEEFIAKIKKLEFEEKTGILIHEVDVKHGAYEMYRKTRDTLVNVIDRISAQLAAEQSEAVVRSTLEAEIRGALSHIREHFKYD